MRNFRSWLESQDYYDKEYRQDMDQHSGHNPRVFAHWFPEGQDRVYIPFQINGDDPTITTNNMPLIYWRHNLDMVLQQGNFTLVDFRKGLVSPKDNVKRQQRIVPILQTIGKQKPENAIKVAGLVKDYEKLPIRLNPGMNNFSIVISQDPHDMALMSYDRSWKKASCMRLKDDKDPGGEKWYQVADEVRDGGLIAYLIDPEDKDIKKPYSRVLLRRFSGKKEIAVCEETVYGHTIPGFLETVKKWIEQKQGAAFGTFTRKGSAWSDTFGDRHSIVPKYSDYNKQNQPHLLEMLDSLDAENFLHQAPPIIAAYKNFDVNFIGEVLDKINLKFKDNPTTIWSISDSMKLQKTYIFHIPNISRILGFSVDKIKDMVKAYPLDKITDIITQEHKGAEETSEYLLPILIDKIKNSDDEYNLDALAHHIDNNPILQRSEFINALEYKDIEEMVHYINNEQVKSLMITRMIGNMKVHLPHLVKSYQNGEEDALDVITDDWVKPIQELLPSNKVSNFMQIVKGLLPSDLYNRLYSR